MWRGRGSRRVRAGVLRSRQVFEDTQPVAQEPRGEEMRAYVLLAGAPELPAELRILQVVERAFRALLGRGHEEARLTLCDLKRDAAHVAADERPRLPEG